MTNKKLTKDQYEALQPYEKSLVNAYRNNYVYLPGADFSRIAEVYAKVFGVALTKSQMGCNTCRLNALRKLGELYVNHQKPEKKTRPKKLEKDGTGEGK